MRAAPASSKARETSGRVVVAAIMISVPFFQRQPSEPGSCFQRGSDDLEQPRRAHAAADAHGDHDVAHAAPLAFYQRVADQPGAIMP
jgi:hypothetical protein